MISSLPQKLALLFLLFSSAVFAQGSRRPGTIELTVMDDAVLETFSSQIAYFGDTFQGETVLDVNLMLPPDDASLCEYPPSLLNMTYDEAQNLTASQLRPIALFVSRGKCSFDQKARVALAIQQNLTKLLKYMVVYNNNFSTPNEVVVMSTSATDEKYDELEDMGFMFVSTNSGLSLANKIIKRENRTNEEATLLSEKNSEWYFPLFLEVKPARTDEGNSGSRYPDGSASARNTFYWLRFVLFTLLIVSPCVRALYLWYTAGGRILVRRNENGRITGLQYVRPMPYWFASGIEVHHQQDDYITARLTEEEVEALPEIVFTCPPEEEDVYKEEKGDDTNSGGLDEINATTRTKESTDSENESIDLEQPLDHAVQSTEESSEITKDEKPKDAKSSMNDNTTTAPPAPEGPQALTTTCTMCSICIDEFEEGEKIRVLPKCRHGFHMECIRPWLTERQSCCPLCKTDVLTRNTTTGDATGGNNNERTNGDSNNTPAGDGGGDAQDSPA